MEDKRVLLLLGGAYHDFEGFAGAIRPVLQAAGYSVTPSFDASDVTRLEEEAVDAVIMYTCLGDRSDGKRIGRDLTQEQTSALTHWVGRGGGLLALHASSVMKESNVTMRRLLGGSFVSHPPQMTFHVTPMHRRHPITQGVEAFSVHDEFYIQDYDSSVDIHMVAENEGTCIPIVWSRHEGEGSVALITLGHGKVVWELDPFQRLVTQSLRWLTRQ